MHHFSLFSNLQAPSTWPLSPRTPPTPKPSIRTRRRRRQMSMTQRPPRTVRACWTSIRLPLNNSLFAWSTNKSYTVDIRLSDMFILVWQFSKSDKDNFLTHICLKTHFRDISNSHLTVTWQSFETASFMTDKWHISFSFLTDFCNWKFSHRYMTYFWNFWDLHRLWVPLYLLGLTFI